MIQIDGTIRGMGSFTFALVLLACFLRGPSVSLAKEQGVLIVPTRVVFEGKKRATTVKLINPNNTERTYRISLVTIRMDEYGARKEVALPDEDDAFAKKLIRFSPRRATIGPKSWQTVRLMVRKPKDLLPGEYRTQLKISPVPGAARSTYSADDKMAIAINVVFGVSIPVIVRHGKGEVRLVPRKPRLVQRDDGYFLETTILREGAYSVFADVFAFFPPSVPGGQAVEIGQRRGISIYTQNSHQIVYVPLKNRDILPLFKSRDQISVQLKDREKEDGRLLGSGRFPVDISGVPPHSGVEDPRMR